MKTTLEVPDDLYALVKAKAALEGRTLRAVVEELLKGWVGREARAGTAALMNRGSGARGHRGSGGARSGERGLGGAGSGGGARSGEAGKVYPWDVLRQKWEREHNPHAPIDQIAGTLKGAGPNLDMAQAREAYMRDIADEWRRREAKGSRGHGDAGGAGNAAGNGSRET